MELQDILARCDHTLLRPDCAAGEIRALCDEAIRYGCASVCIPPAHVAGAKKYVGDRMKICTVIGFPNGYNTTGVKCMEAETAVADGASEIDMVVNLGWVKEGRYDLVLQEINSIKVSCHGHTLKVIIETCLLTEEEKIKLCETVAQSNADYIKTSTGFAGGGATREDVKLMVEHTPGKKVKAAGGIADLKDAEDFLALGADRLGTSRIVKAAKAMES